MDEFLQKLTPEQKYAVEIDKDVLITAIPGSGKTRTLINKIIKSFDKNDNKIIIAITFTRRAANEIEDRLHEILGYLPMNIWVGTIHKFCLDFIVRGYGSYSERFSSNFEILSEPDAEKIKIKLEKKYELKPYTPIDYTLNKSGEPNELIYKDLVCEFYNETFVINKIDFNYILYESYRILSEYQFIARQLSILFKIILIDEFQDTQELQYQIISLLLKNQFLGIFIVGDANQSIYEGIGGVIKTKEELNTLFQRDIKELHLTGCFRSNQVVIDFYKQFAIDKYDMSSKTDKWRNPEVKIYTTYTKKQVYQDIFEKVKNLVKNGYKENEIAILAPQWYQLFDISNEIRKKLPDLKFDAPNLVPLKKDEDGLINKICRLLLTEFDYYNLYRIKRFATEIIDQFQVEYGYTINYNVMEFLNLINSSKTDDKVGTIYLQNSLINLFDKLCLLDSFIESINEFIFDTSTRIKKFEDQGLENDKIYFEQSLRSKNGIVISTFHGVKGEEYAVVLAFGLLEGYIPHWNDKINFSSEIARKRSSKLLFVITSRAKEKLFLYSETDRKTTNGNIYEVNFEIKRAFKNIMKVDNL